MADSERTNSTTPDEPQAADTGVDDSRSHVLVVGGGTGLIQRYRPQCRTSVFCNEALMARVADPGRHVRVLGLPAEGPDEDWIEAARALHREVPVTAIVAFGEADARRVPPIAAALNLPAPSAEVTETVFDKARMRAALAEQGVERVQAIEVDSAGALADWVRRHPGQRWVVKPVDGTASAGVSTVDDPAQAETAYLRCVASSQSGPDRVLVEEFLSGPQISVEAVSERGEHCVVALTRKYSDPVGFVELGHVTPAPVEPELVERIGTHLVRALDAIGVQNGLTHTELVLTPAGPRLLETHLRGGGDQIPDLVAAATGVDLLAVLIDQLLGARVLPGVRRTLAESTGRAQAIWFGTPPCAGTLVEITGLTAAAKLDPSVQVQRLLSDGTELTGLRDSTSRVLSARAAGDDAAAAIALAHRAIATCRVVLTTPATGPLDEAV